MVSGLLIHIVQYSVLTRGGPFRVSSTYALLLSRGRWLTNGRERGASVHASGASLSFWWRMLTLNLFASDIFLPPFARNQYFLKDLTKGTCSTMPLNGCRFIHSWQLHYMLTRKPLLKLQCWLRSLEWLHSWGWSC